MSFTMPFTMTIDIMTVALTMTFAMLMTAEKITGSHLSNVNTIFTPMRKGPLDVLTQ